MDFRQNPLWLSFPAGRWFGVDVRISLLFPLMILVFAVRLGPELGLWVSALLFVSILLHEYGHVLMARATGGAGNEILMWPLGGLAFVTPGPTLAAEFWTAAAGPLVNLLICTACLPVVLQSGQLAECLQLIELPRLQLQLRPGRDGLLLLFALNFKLLLLNLLPVHPLDGGRMALVVARRFWDRQRARIGTLWLGLLVCILLLLLGGARESTGIILVASVLFMLCMHEHLLAQMPGQQDESFLGYDFSQGYARFAVDDEPAARPGPLTRWKQQRDEKRREREMQQKIETERRVDELLEKVHQFGMDSLTDEERRFLTQASGRYRGR